MGEERSGWTDGARHGLRFYAQCAGDAWRRSWDAANAWPTVLVLLLFSGGARLAGVDLTGPVDAAYGAPAGVGLLIVASWLAVVLVQFVTAPPRLYARLDAEMLALTRRLFAPSMKPVAALPAPAEAPASVLPVPILRDAAQAVIALPGPESALATLVPPPDPQPDPQPEPPPAMSTPTRPAARPALPPIDVRLHDQVHETTAVDTTGDMLPPSRAYMARVTNRSDRTVRRCQLFFCNPMHIQVVSGPFDLAPGDHRDLPVLRVVDEADDPHALLYFLDAETWHVAQGQAAWLPEPGRFKVKVLSADAATAALDVRLSCSTGAPPAWTLVEATEPDKVPKAGRKRSAWASSDAVAEPASGD